MSTLAANLEMGMKPPMLKADGGNWFSWKARMELQLGRRGHIGHLRVTQSVPPDPALAAGFDYDAVQADPSLQAQFRTDERAFLHWQNENNAVLLHIVSGLPESLTTKALRHKLANKLWTWLLNEFEKKGDAFAQALRRTFEEKRCAAAGDVRTHMDDMDEIRAKYDAAASEPMLDSEYYRTVLASLPDFYRNFVARIRTTAEVLGQGKPEPEVLLRAVRNEFDRITVEKPPKSKVAKDDVDDVALAAEVKGKKKFKPGKLDKSKLKCFGCGGLGHFANENKCDPATKAAYEASKPDKAKKASSSTKPSSSETKRAASPDVSLTARVLENGVDVSRAEPDGDDPSTWLNGLYDDGQPLCEPETTGVPLSALVASESPDGKSTAEIVDSGASRHMSSLGSRFVTLRPIAPHPIIAAEGAVFHATMEGDYVLRVPREDSGEREIMLRNTLYAQSLQGTLVSVSTIDKRGGEVHFAKGVAKIYDVNQRVVGVIPQQDGLYQIKRPSEQGARALYSYASQKRPLTYMELHRVMGHVSPAAAKAQWLRGGFKGVKVDESSELFDCKSCTMGKINAARIPKVREGPRSTVFGEVWYSDIWGKAPVESCGRKLYCEPYTDDATHWRVPYFYRKKDEAEDTVPEHDAWLENQFGVRWKLWITDQAGEYKDGQLKAYLKRRGIVHPMTTHDTHQQVGVAERFNRTLFERVRACMNASGMPAKLWAECVNHQSWLLNRLGTRANEDNKSPFEARKLGVPDISGVPEWGAPCYVFDMKAKKIKDHGERVHWMGFDTITPTKGHRLWSKKKQKVIVEPEVKFLRLEPDREEDVFKTDVGDLFWDSRWDEDGADPGEDTVPAEAPVTPADDTGADGSATVNHPRTPERAAVPLPAPDAPPRAPAIRRFTARMDEVDSNIVKGPRIRKPSQYVRDVRDGMGTADGRPSQPALPRGLQVPPEVEAADVARAAFVNAQQLFGYVDFAAAAVSQHADPQLLEPASHAEALARPDSTQWIAAEQEERTSLRDKDVYVWVSREEVAAKGRRPVGSKWVYRGKRDAAGHLARYKARLVAQGYSTIPGVDYTDTTAPVATLETLRFIISVAALYDWELEQIDFDTAFLNGKLDREVFLEPPPGYDDDPMHPVRLFCWQLLKAIYGLKDAA